MADQIQQSGEQQNDMGAFLAHIMRFFGLGEAPATTTGLGMKKAGPVDVSGNPVLGAKRQQTLDDLIKMDKGTYNAPAAPGVGMTNVQRSQQIMYGPGALEDRINQK